MALSGGVCDTRCQAFFTSVIENENRMRVKWFLKHEKQLMKNLEDSKLKQNVGTDLIPLSKENKNSRKTRRKSIREKKEHNKDNLPTFSRPTKNGVLDISIMRPIDAKIKNILYEPGVETYTAANQYLYERRKKKPEDRFYYPECTSWNYGWRLEDHSPIPISKVGIVRTSFHSRDASSLKRDPDWYKICQTKNPKNFNDILTY